MEFNFYFTIGPLHLLCVVQINNNNNSSWKVIYDSLREIRHMGSACNVVPQVEKCQNPVLVIFISKNPSTNLCCCLQRLLVSSKGEISLHFDLPVCIAAVHGHRARCYGH